MADLVEVAIEKALFAHLDALTFSPSSIAISYPNKEFTKPNPSVKTSCYLRANSLLRAPTTALSVGFADDNQHLGIFQVDVFHALGIGMGAPGRIAAQIVSWFARGTTLASDGYRVQITRPPYASSPRPEEAWLMIPVSIPYQTFAANPA